MFDKHVLAQIKIQQQQPESLSREINKSVTSLIGMQMNAISQINTRILKQSASIQPTMVMLEDTDR